MINNIFKSSALVLAALLLSTTTNVAQAQVANAQCGSQTITFDDHASIPLATATTTTVISNQYATGSANNPLPAGAGVSFTFTGGSGNFGTVYNSTRGTNGQDDDLEGVLNNGAGPVQGVGTGNILIVEENGSVANPGAPDDAVGGTIIIDYELPIAEFAVRFVDFEEPDVQFEFYDLDLPINNAGNTFPTGEGNPVIITNGDLQAASGSPYAQTGCLFGDGLECDIDNGITTANGTGAGLIDINKIDRVIVNMAAASASGGIDNIRVELACETLVLEGNVFNDTNGDANVDGSGTNAGGLFASLIKDGVVVESVAVAADGTYLFNNASPNTVHTVQLNTTAQTLGVAPSAPNLPATWVNTGENLGLTGNDGTVDGILSVSMGTISVDNANFGIQQPPPDIGDLIFFDLNADGIFNGADFGIPNVEVELCSPAANISISDDFDNVDYNNNSSQWGGAWLEENDNASATAPGDISISLSGESLVFDTDGGADSNPNPQLTRTLDLSAVTGNATLTIPWVGGTGNHELNDVVSVQISTGGAFTEVFRFIGDFSGTTPANAVQTQSSSGTQLITFDPQGSDTVSIRFVMDQFWGTNESLSFGSVTVTASVPEICQITTTDANGNYLFEDLANGNYTVTVDPDGDTLPNNIIATPTADPQGALDGMSDVVLSFSDDLDQDFGYQLVRVISGNVSQDTDGDSFGNVNLSGVTVQLYNADASGNPTSLVAATTTDGGGNYLFTNATVSNGLPAGNYAVVEIDPAGLRAVNDGDASSPDAGTDAANVSILDNLIPVDLEPSETDADNNFVDAATASLEGTVWLDEDLDGILDTEETGITQVIVELYSAGVLVASTVSDANGNYSFSNLFPATYEVRVTDGAGTPLETLSNTAGLGGVEPKGGIVVNAGDQITDVNFGYIPRNGLGAIGDRVWADANDNGIQDAGEAGIAGVVLELRDSNGDQVGATVTTNENGDYLFSDVPFGEDYIVQIPSTVGPLAGFTPTQGPQSEGGYVGSPVTLENTLRVVTDVDFGFNNAELNTLTDAVWFDEDADGIYDADENGIAGITVDIVDAADQVIATAITDQNGDVSFSGLPNGTYRLRVTDNADGLDGLNGTTSEGIARLSDEVTFALATAETDDQSSTSTGVGSSFGFNNPGIISGTVYSDPDDLAATNNDQDPGEAGIAGSTVTLLLEDPNNPGTFNVVDTVVTDIRGDYAFDGLLPGNYRVQVSAPAGGTQTEDPDGELGRNNQTDIPLGIGQSSVDNDFGYFDVPDLFAISGVVFLDLDKDGVEEKPQDVGFQNVTLALIDVATGDVISTTTTADGSVDADGDGDVDADDLGYYEFTGLPAGDYRVSVTDNDAQLAGYDITSGLDVLSATIVASDIIDVDFGYIREEATGSIAGEVFIDEDKDGIAQDSEFDISNVEVHLCVAPIVPANVSEADGALAFKRFDLTTAGTTSVNQIEANGTLLEMSTSSSFAIQAADVGTNDFGYIYSGFINAPVAGDYTFSTTSDDGSSIRIDGILVVDNDGIQPPTTESGTINLSAGFHTIEVRYFESAFGENFSASFTPPAGSPQALGLATLASSVSCTAANPKRVATTTTDVNGEYIFRNLPPAQYIVDSDPSDIPGGLDLTVDPAVVSLSEGEDVTEVDVGYEPTADSGVLSGFVWVDSSPNGVFETNEAPIGGASIYVYDSSTATEILPFGTLIFTTTTKPDGSWIISNIVAPELTDGLLVTYEPANLDALAGVDLNQDQPTNMPVGDTQYFPVDLDSDPDKNISFLDFGFDPNGVNLGSISGTIYSDADQNGGYDNAVDGELGGVTLNLRNSAGVVISTTVTNASGFYQFLGLTDGDYTVEITDNINVTKDLNANELIPDPITIVSASSVNDQDAGFVSDLAGLFTIGNRFFFDANDNGQIDDNEPGIEGVTIQCWLDADASEDADNANVDSSAVVPQPGVDNLIRTVKTDSAGEYYCTSLPAGQYIVVVADALDYDETNDGADVTGNAGDTFAKNWSYALTLDSSGPNFAADFGVTGPNTLSGTVFVEDAELVEPAATATTIDPGVDLDGVAGLPSPDTAGGADSPVVANIPIDLLVEQPDGSFEVLQSTLTGPDGEYNFAGLPDGRYQVRVRPNGTGIDGFGQTGDPDLLPLFNVSGDPTDLVCDSITAALCDDQTSATAPLDLDSGSVTGPGVSIDNIDFGYQRDFTTTPVAMNYFLATRNGGRVDFSWETSNEVGHAGFQIYARNGDDWDLLTPQLIVSAANALSAMQTREYGFSAETDAEWFALVDVSNAEKVTPHGPFRVGEKYGSEPDAPAAFDWSAVAEAPAPTVSEVSELVKQRTQQLNVGVDDEADAAYDEAMQDLESLDAEGEE